MTSIVEFLAKKHQGDNQYPLVTFEELLNDGNKNVLFIYYVENKKILEGYIISTNDEEICKITELPSFRDKHDHSVKWKPIVYDNIQTILNNKLNKDINIKDSGWHVLTSKIIYLLSFETKYYDIRQ